MLKSNFDLKSKCFPTYVTNWVQSGKCSLSKPTNQQPARICMLFPSVFSPANRKIFTLDVGSPLKGRDLEQGIPSSQADDLTAYL